MRFKEYLIEMEITPRKGIIHFQDIKPIDFLKLGRELIGHNKKLKNVKTSLKVDGLSGRFGKDSDSKFFFESGRSGIIQMPKAFSTYTMSKGGSDEMIARSVHYDDIYDLLEASDLWKDLPNGTKIVCEILYNPMAQLIKDKLKFVSIQYNKSKLGNIMTIVPISVIGDYDLEDLYKKSTKDIKIVSAHLGHIDIELDIDLDVLNEIDEDILVSRKHADREMKIEYIALLQDIKDEISSQILHYPIIGKDKLGKEIEGLVIELGGQLYKITTPSFRQEKRDERVSRIERGKQ